MNWASFHCIQNSEPVAFFLFFPFSTLKLSFTIFQGEITGLSNYSSSCIMCHFFRLLPWPALYLWLSAVCNWDVLGCGLFTVFGFTEPLESVNVCHFCSCFFQLCFLSTFKTPILCILNLLIASFNRVQRLCSFSLSPQSFFSKFLSVEKFCP